MTGSVAVNADSVKRVLAYAHDSGAFLAVVATSGADQVTGGLEAAVAAANAAVDSDALRGAVIGRGSRGPLILLARHPDRFGAHTAWLDVLCETLASSGMTGVVRPSMGRSPAGWHPIRPGRGYPTVWCAYPLVDDSFPPKLLRGWLAETSTTRAAGAELAAACSAAGGAARVAVLGRSTPIAVDSLEAALVHGAEVSSGLAGQVAGPGTLRACQLELGGTLIYRESAPDAPWEELLERARTLLTALPEDQELAFVRSSGQAAPHLANFYDPGSGQVPLLGMGHWQVSRHVWSEFTLDAHGINLLTAAHLDKADDLSQWRTRRTSSGRFLVEARDLAPWFDSWPVDQTLVERARADFGAMILTEPQFPPGAYA